MIQNKHFEHLIWLTKTGVKLKTTDGNPVEVFEYRHQSNETILKRWAQHFRNHYCCDSEIDLLRDGTGHSRADYLSQLKFPDATKAPGPSIRAGDFGEILIADYLEHILHYLVPRTRYADKTIRNESTKGCDVIGFKFLKEGEVSKDDILAMVAAKFPCPSGCVITT